MSIAPSVEKIGGTSISSTETVLANVLLGGRSGADLYNRIFVVSAYGGITDLLLDRKKKKPGDDMPSGLYACFTAEDSSVSWEEALTAVDAAMRAKNAEIFEGPERGIADSFVAGRIAGIRACIQDLDRLRGHGHFRLDEPLATLRELLAGFGEAHSAHNTTLLLRAKGVNACFVDLTGWDDQLWLDLDERIRIGLDDIDFATTLPIVTGYARCKGGMVKQFDRGYTEMTFARLAILTGAREAIIHKEFHLSSADPKLVGPDKARKIGQTNYEVADQLAGLGVEAIHPGAARGLRQAGISLRVRNTFDRYDDGTLISAHYHSDSPRIEIVTGLSDVTALEFFEHDMVGTKGYDAGILEVLTKHGAKIVSKASNANTITHYLAARPSVVRQVVADLEARFSNAEINAKRVSMVSIIGTDISQPGLELQAMQALQNAKVTVLAMQHQLRNVDVQFIVAQDQFDRTIQALHVALVESDTSDSPLASERPLARVA